MTKTEEILQLLYKPDHASKQAAIAMIEGLVKDSERLDLFEKNNFFVHPNSAGLWQINIGLTRCFSAPTIRDVLDKVKGKS